MATKTIFKEEQLGQILSNYNLGEFKSFTPISQGTIQTNYILQTARGKYVFRYYENRPIESVIFECSLIKFLKTHAFPCPDVIINNRGELAGSYIDKPYAIFEFAEGEHLENPSDDQKNQLIKKVAELHNLTKNYKPVNKQYRWNYDIKLCRELAQKEAAKLNTPDAGKVNTSNGNEKLVWLENELGKLELPESLPRGICHCDFHFSNVLFRDGKFAALIDFDDANYTYLVYDLVGLIESEAWARGLDNKLNFTKAKSVVREYMKYRALGENEKKYLFDVYKLSILFDCVWYFGRGQAEDFYEKKKIEFLNGIGREKFYAGIFG